MLRLYRTDLAGWPQCVRHSCSITHKFHHRFGYETEDGDFRVEQRLGSGQLRGFAGTRTQDGTIINAYRLVLSRPTWPVFTQLSRQMAPNVAKITPNCLRCNGEHRVGVPGSHYMTRIAVSFILFCRYTTMAGTREQPPFTTQRPPLP